MGPYIVRMVVPVRVQSFNSVLQCAEPIERRRAKRWRPRRQNRLDMKTGWTENRPGRHAAGGTDRNGWAELRMGGAGRRSRSCFSRSERWEFSGRRIGVIRSRGGRYPRLSAPDQGFHGLVRDGPRWHAGDRCSSAAPFVRLTVFSLFRPSRSPVRDGRNLSKFVRPVVRTNTLRKMALADSTGSSRPH